MLPAGCSHRRHYTPWPRARHCAHPALRAMLLRRFARFCHRICIVEMTTRTVSADEGVRRQFVKLWKAEVTRSSWLGAVGWRDEVGSGLVQDSISSLSLAARALVNAGFNPKDGRVLHGMSLLSAAFLVAARGKESKWVQCSMACIR